MTASEIVQVNIPPDYIDLGLGDPDNDFLPLELIQASVQAYFAAPDPRPLQYGAQQGDGHFRLALAEFLTSAYGSAVDPQSLFISAGASSALDLICTLFTNPGDLIFVEEPSYFLALRIFRDHGLQAASIPIDKHGLRIDILDGMLAEAQPKFLYTVPTFQNPSGVTLDQARRDMLVERAQAHNFLILADEVYHFLPYTRLPPDPFALFTSQVQQVISVNSFSKILSPGLRLGWVQAHPQVVERLAGSGLLESGGGLNPFVSALVCQAVESGGLTKNITSLRQAYKSRCNLMDRALGRYLPGAEYSIPVGGYFYWLHLPGIDTGELRRQAWEFKVDFRQGSLFSSQSGLNDYLRLSFSFYPAAQIEEGVKRLGDCLSSS